MSLSNFIPDPHRQVQETQRRRKVGGAIGNKNVKNIKRGTHSNWRETLGERDCTDKEQ